jgi:hypothetical protein
VSIEQNHHHLPNRDTVSSLLDRRDYLVKKIEAGIRMAPEEKAPLRAEIDAITAALDFTRIVLNQMPEEQLCKIIAKNDAIHGIPPSSDESIIHRIERARATVSS